MGRVTLGPLKIDYKYLYIAAGLLAVLLAAAAVWYFTIERLPGYDMDPVMTQHYVEPGGIKSEYFTGIVKSTEVSILGPKMTVTMDYANNDREFFLASGAPVWLGLIIGDKKITGLERIYFTDLKPGWRVAVFVGPENRARRVNVLKRTNAED